MIMHYETGKAENVKIAYIGGGSRGWAWQLMGDLALEKDMSGEVALYDIDFEAARRNEVIGNRIREIPEAQGEWKYTAVETIAQALTGANFVVISILPGTFDEMESDVHAPEKYGVYQSVGDTAGPGGLVRGLRAGGMFVEIAQAIKEYCPEAWVINYTNPMAQMMRVLYAVYPGIRAVGCCHEVFSTQTLLTKALREIKGIENVDRHELVTTVQGVNHFTWITDAHYRDIDLFPVYREFADKHWQEGYVEGEDGNWMNRYFDCAHRVKFDLFKNYGAIAAAGDRHLAEFNPSTRYLKDPDTVHSWKFTLTPVSWRKEDLQKRLERAERLYSGKEHFELKKSGEEGVKMMKALIGLGDMATNVNMPNRGQIPNVPLGTIIETNAYLSVAGIRPIYAGEMAPQLLALSMPAMANQVLILDAILHKKASAAMPAFLGEPLNVTLTAKDARALYRTMLENTRAYLPGWDFDV